MKHPHGHARTKVVSNYTIMAETKHRLRQSQGYVVYVSLAPLPVQLASTFFFNYRLTDYYVFSTRRRT